MPPGSRDEETTPQPARDSKEAARELERQGLVYRKGGTDSHGLTRRAWRGQGEGVRERVCETG